jgi:hypothetical protein
VDVRGPARRRRDGAEGRARRRSSPWNAAPAVGTGFDNTAANTVDVFFTQTVGTGSMTVHQYAIEELN